MHCGVGAYLLPICVKGVGCLEGFQLAVPVQTLHKCQVGYCSVCLEGLQFAHIVWTEMVIDGVKDHAGCCGWSCKHACLHVQQPLSGTSELTSALSTPISDTNLDTISMAQYQAGIGRQLLVLDTVLAGIQAASRMSSPCMPRMLCRTHVTR